MLACPQNQKPPPGGHHVPRSGLPGPGVRLIEISERVGVTERAGHRIVAELAAAGYITRKCVGRRNRQTIESDLPLPDRLTNGRKVGDLLAILAGQS